MVLGFQRLGFFSVVQLAGSSFLKAYLRFSEKSSHCTDLLVSGLGLGSRLFRLSRCLALLAKGLGFGSHWRMCRGQVRCEKLGNG